MAQGHILTLPLADGGAAIGDVPDVSSATRIPASLRNTAYL